MSSFIVRGGHRLSGIARVHGAKNSVLPILAATLISGCESVIHNCPCLTDVDASCKILRYLGCSVNRQGDTIVVNSANLDRCDIPDDLMREMRSSVIFLGAILARHGSAALTYPGGCELGRRPIDLHIEALQKLGAQIDEREGRIICTPSRLRGCTVQLRFPSVGATENTMLAACRAEGETVIRNAAREPEIVDLQHFLCAMGADVRGAGTEEITIRGGNTLHEAEHRVIGDRIVACTFLSSAACAGGEVEVVGADPTHLTSFTELLRQAGCRIVEEPGRVVIEVRERLQALGKIVSTSPYPGFPTDAQAPLMASLLRAQGTSEFVENIFENRFRHAQQMKKLGAQIRIEGRRAWVTGVEKLHGAQVAATDLRGGAALVAALLGAEGEGEVTGIHHIDRGYWALDQSLSALGAQIWRK